MTPEAPEPLDMALHHRIAGQIAQRIKDVVAAHLLESPEQSAGVIEHDAWLAAILYQLRNQRRHAFVAVGEWFSVVVIPLAGMFNHVLQMGNQPTVPACRDGGLMHMQRTAEAGVDLFEPPAWLRACGDWRALHQGQQLGLPAGNRGKHGDLQELPS